MHDPIWVTKDGRRMKISQMDDRHLANCIAKIIRSGCKWRGYYLDRLLIEQEIRRLPKS